MKFTVFATAIAATILCSAVEAAYMDKKCYNQEMRLSKYQTILCGRYHIQNTCKTEERIRQPTAGKWIDTLRSVSASDGRVGCFEATSRPDNPRCREKEIQIAASENIICTDTSFKNTCKSKKGISQSAAADMMTKLSGAKKIITNGCFEATKLF
ncbi:hypothetical protein BGX34_006043 [Mortierella sp. NVP85]|nr:hypothetical protein BGX34_006043 [Mortierella sp. NVP85]